MRVVAISTLSFLLLVLALRQIAQEQAAPAVREAPSAEDPENEALIRTVEDASSMWGVSGLSNRLGGSVTVAPERR